MTRIVVPSGPNNQLADLTTHFMASANLPFENEQFSNKSATNNKENSGGLQENHEHLEPLEVL